MTTTQRKRYDYPVPPELRQPSQIRIYGINIEGDDFVIEFVDTKDKTQYIKSHIDGNKTNDVESVRELVKSRLSNFFDEIAAKYCAGQVADVIDRYYDKEMAHAINEIKKRREEQIKKLEGQANGDEDDEAHLKKQYIQKYHDKQANVLYEAVLIAGRPYFVWQEWEVGTGEPFARV